MHPTASFSTFQSFISARRVCIGCAMKLRMIVLFFSLSATLNLFWAARDLGWLTIPSLLAGWYIADMLSGLVHMFMDYHPCPRGKGLDRLYFYEGSRGSEEYQALFRQTMARI